VSVWKTGLRFDNRKKLSALVISSRVASNCHSPHGSWKGIGKLLRKIRVKGNYVSCFRSSIVSLSMAGNFQRNKQTDSLNALT
jgi:hypothetical protein